MLVFGATYYVKYTLLSGVLFLPNITFWSLRGPLISRQPPMNVVETTNIKFSTHHIQRNAPVSWSVIKFCKDRNRLPSGQTPHGRSSGWVAGPLSLTVKTRGALICDRRHISVVSLQSLCQNILIAFSDRRLSLFA